MLAVASKLCFRIQRVAKIGATMIPDLRRAHHSEAIWAAAMEIAQIVARDRGVTLSSAVAPQPVRLEGTAISRGLPGAF